MIGCALNCNHSNLPLIGVASIEVVVRHVVDELKAEVIVITQTLSYDLLDQGIRTQRNLPNKVAFGGTEERDLAEICRSHGWAFSDLYTAAYDWLESCDRPIIFYGLKRTWKH